MATPRTLLREGKPAASLEALDLDPAFAAFAIDKVRADAAADTEQRETAVEMERRRQTSALKVTRPSPLLPSFLPISRRRQREPARWRQQRRWG